MQAQSIAGCFKVLIICVMGLGCWACKEKTVARDPAPNKPPPSPAANQHSADHQVSSSQNNADNEVNKKTSGSSLVLELGKELWKHSDWRATTFKPVNSPDGRYLAFELFEQAKSTRDDIYVGVFDREATEMILLQRKRSPLGFFKGGRYLLVGTYSSPYSGANGCAILDMASGVELGELTGHKQCMSSNNFPSAVEPLNNPNFFVRHKSGLFQKFDAAKMVLSSKHFYGIPGRKELTIGMSTDVGEVYSFATFDSFAELRNKNPFICFVAQNTDSGEVLREVKDAAYLAQRLDGRDEALIVNSEGRVMHLDLKTATVKRRTEPTKELLQWTNEYTRRWEYVPSKDMLILYSTGRAWFLNTQSFQIAGSFDSSDLPVELGLRSIDFIKHLPDGALLAGVGGRIFSCELINP